MPEAADSRLLAALLDSWDRSNTILVNLLRALPGTGLETRALPRNPSVGQLFMHMHFVRLVVLSEADPEFGGEVPEGEWVDERDSARIASLLAESAASVRGAVRALIQSDRQTDLHYDHPVLLLQHLLWHEAYHHGQIKLTLKLAGFPLSDERAGPLTWDLWMLKSAPGDHPPGQALRP